MRTLTRRNFVGSALASAAWLRPALATAQDLPLPAQNFSLPPASEIAPGSLLQPGARLTWFGASASIAGERSQIEPDNDGTWVNRRTGQRFRQFDTPTASGAGLTVVDVMSAGPNGFVLQITGLLLHPDLNNATTFIDTNGMVAVASNISDFWLSPAQLAQFTDRNEAGLRVLHMPYTLGARTYRAVRIQSQNLDGWTQSTYDLDTGIALVTWSSV